MRFNRADSGVLLTAKRRFSEADLPLYQPAHFMSLRFPGLHAARNRDTLQEAITLEFSYLRLNFRFLRRQGKGFTPAKALRRAIPLV